MGFHKICCLLSSGAGDLRGGVVGVADARAPGGQVEEPHLASSFIVQWQGLTGLQAREGCILTFMGTLQVRTK